MNWNTGGRGTKEGVMVLKSFCCSYAIPVLCLLFLVSLYTVTALTRDDFPSGFIFGAGTSAYQVEGAVAEDGRKPSIWDTFAHEGRVADKSNADVAADQYHRYKEDVKLMHETGLDAYRFSISWSRLIPDGRGPINPKGLEYYNNLINQLVYYGIEPHVTLYHFDLPQALQEEYGGILSSKIIEDFTAYADICFKTFGDRVKHWITFNEPNIEAVIGYDVGNMPPARCSYPFGFNCSGGDSTREPYIFAHHILLSHLSAAKLYKSKYQATQGGKIGITILGFWFEPYTNSLEDIAAAERMKDFHLGWFLNPLAHGTYPSTMKRIVKSRLPSFSTEESKQLKASSDFIGVNHYGFMYLQANTQDFDEDKRDYIRDAAVKLPMFGGNAFEKAFVKRGMPPLFPTPWTLQKQLEYIKIHYRNPPIIIHENGYGEFNVKSTLPWNEDDYNRSQYLQMYIEGLHLSIRNGSNAHGYFVWSFVDCFELMFGYTARFGLYGVDFNAKDRTRYPRLSARWYSKFLRPNSQIARDISSSVYVQ